MKEIINAIRIINKVYKAVLKLLELCKNLQPDKKWLNVEQTAYYTGYSKSTIHKLIQEEWIEGVHYHKPTPKRVVIDKIKVDEWIIGKHHSNHTQKLLDEIL